MENGRMIIGIEHVQITIPVGAEAAAKTFYCGVLGLEEVEKPDALKGRGGFWLRVGAQMVHVGTETTTARQETKAHVAYLVDDLAAWRVRLHEAQIDIKESIPIPNFLRFEFRDPFGNRVELMQLSV